MTMRPDPTFHASPKLAMEAPPENFAYEPNSDERNGRPLGRPFSPGFPP